VVGPKAETNSLATTAKRNEECIITARQEENGHLCHFLPPNNEKLECPLSSTQKWLSVKHFGINFFSLSGFLLMMTKTLFLEIESHNFNLFRPINIIEIRIHG
jgi:hypothetical protein